MIGENSLYIEKPIDSPADDRLGFSESAKVLSDTIFSLGRDDAFTFAVTGKWGMGKTSFLNLVKYYIRNEHKHEYIRTVLLDIDTSCLFTTEAIFNEYFKQLYSAIEKKKKTSLSKKLFSTLKVYSKEVFSMVETVTKVNGLSSFLTKTMDLFSPNSNDSFLQKRALLEKEMEKSGLWFIVFIDDIDRLQKEQIKSVIQLVYAIGKFKGTKFVLGYDHEVVSNAISEYYGNGDDYLKKIVQKEIKVPFVLGTVIRNYLFEDVCEILDITADKDKLDFFEIFSDMYEYCIRPFVNTLRDIHLVVNEFKFAYNAIGYELEVEDLLAITALRVLNKRLYDFIYKNRNMFFNVKENFMDSLLASYSGNSQNYKEEYAEELKKEIASWVLTEDELKALCYLFPLFKKNYFDDDINYYSRNDFLDARKHHIWFDKYFSSYFTERLSDGMLPRAEINRILEVYNEKQIVNIHKELLRNGSFNTWYLQEIEAYGCSEEREKIFTSALILTYPFALETTLNTVAFSSPANSLCNLTIPQHLKKLGQEQAFDLVMHFILGADFGLLYHVLATIIRYGNDINSSVPGLFPENSEIKLRDDFLKQLKSLIHSDTSPILFDDSCNLGLFILLDSYIKSTDFLDSEFPGWMNKVLEDPKQMLIYYMHTNGASMPNYKPDYLTVLTRQDEILGEITESDIEEFDETLLHWYNLWIQDMQKNK